METVKIKVIKRTFGQDQEPGGISAAQKLYEKDESYDVHPSFAKSMIAGGFAHLSKKEDEEQKESKPAAESKQLPAAPQNKGLFGKGNKQTKGK